MYRQLKDAKVSLNSVYQFRSIYAEKKPLVCWAKFSYRVYHWLSVRVQKGHNSLINNQLRINCKIVCLHEQHNLMKFYSVCGLRGVAMTKHRTDGLIDGLKKNHHTFHYWYWVWYKYWYGVWYKYWYGVWYKYWYWVWYNYIQWSTPPLEGRMVVAILRIPVHRSHPGGELCIMIKKNIQISENFYFWNNGINW